MRHNFRNERSRGHDRDERMRSRGHYSRGDDSYSPSWDDPNAARGFEGDRSYRTEGDSREHGRSWRDFQGQDEYRGDDYTRRTRQDRDTNWGARENNAGRGGWYSDNEPGEPWRQRGRGVGLMRWDDRGDDTGDYFGTGSYYGGYGSQPSASASGSAYGDRGYLGAGESRWDDLREERDDNNRDWYRGSSGSYETYGRSDYGAQSGYGRDYGQRFGNDSGYGQNYRERFAEQRYGRDPEFGYGFAREGTQGTFRGRGPKGYERSDERLREMICERLTDDPRIDASDVNVEVKDKVVKLTGFVSDRRSKYEIEDVVEHCGGVKDIDNQVRVRASGITQSSGNRVSGTEGSSTTMGETSERAGTRSTKRAQ